MKGSGKKSVPGVLHEGFLLLYDGWKKGSKMREQSISSTIYYEFEMISLNVKKWCIEMY